MNKQIEYNKINTIMPIIERHYSAIMNDPRDDAKNIFEIFIQSNKNLEHNSCLIIIWPESSQLATVQFTLNTLIRDNKNLIDSSKIKHLSITNYQNTINIF